MGARRAQTIHQRRRGRGFRAGAGAGRGRRHLVPGAGGYAGLPRRARHRHGNGLPDRRPRRSCSTAAKSATTRCSASPAAAWSTRSCGWNPRGCPIACATSAAPGARWKRRKPKWPGATPSAPGARPTCNKIQPWYDFIGPARQPAHDAGLRRPHGCRLIREAAQRHGQGLRIGSREPRGGPRGADDGRIGPVRRHARGHGLAGNAPFPHLRRRQRTASRHAGAPLAGPALGYPGDHDGTPDFPGLPPACRRGGRAPARPFRHPARGRSVRRRHAHQGGLRRPQLQGRAGPGRPRRHRPRVSAHRRHRSLGHRAAFRRPGADTGPGSRRARLRHRRGLRRRLCRIRARPPRLGAAATGRHRPARRGGAGRGRLHRRALAALDGTLRPEARPRRGARHRRRPAASPASPSTS